LLSYFSVDSITRREIVWGLSSQPLRLQSTCLWSLSCRAQQSLATPLLRPSR